ncbi:glutamate--tRNA ligase [Thermodesulfobacteriota bacterium]
MHKIVTRFPPSPTGYLHVGGARTALFNWLYARHMKGKFVLRIEDTDIARSTQASVDAIFEALEWLEIDWDEGPFFQSRRFGIYQEYIRKLLDTGHAYCCTCSSDTLEKMRQKAMAEGGKPKYDGTCREKGLTESSDAVVRFRAPLTGTTIVKDVVKGNIVFQNAELDDFIIRRSDGTPTYNFVVVVDDITMGINSIIRGDDHVMNTPKQILIYNALEDPLPIFAHVPMVLGDDRTRLSKRHGAMSVTAYRDMGYLPDAMINYLVRLGWSFGDQEFFSRDELIEKFSLDNVGKSAGVFNPEKLLALNAEHIRNSLPQKLATYLLPLLKEKGVDARQGAFLESVAKTLNVRSKTLIEMADGALFYFQDRVIYDEKAAQKFLKPGILDAVKLLMRQIEKTDDFSEKNLEAVFETVMEATGLKLGKIAQPVRVALTGKAVSPGIFEIISVLGKELTLARLKEAVQYIENRDTG